jgi:hypothetical protein
MMAAKKNGFRWTYVGILGPFQIIDGDNHVVCTFRGIGNDPNKNIELVASITRQCERHAKKLAASQGQEGGTNG